MIDVHCHCLPGLDDGPADLKTALELCIALVADGVTTVAATPHQLGRYERLNSAASVRRAVDSLQLELNRLAIPLTVYPGADVRIHERLAGMLSADEVMTLADGKRWLLLEMPGELFIDITGLLKQLQSQGVSVVLSHPERYPWVRRRLPQVVAWRKEAGIKVQITAASLLGDFGPDIADLAWQIASADAVDLVAGDTHSVEGLRRPRMTDARHLVCNRLGEEVADNWFERTPRMLLGL